MMKRNTAASTKYPAWHAPWPRPVGSRLSGRITINAAVVEQLLTMARKPAGCVTRKDMRRAERAMKNHKPATRAVQQVALRNEKRLAKWVKGTHIPDNEPFDMLVGTVDKPKHLVEVKTIVRGKNDKITMHPSSLRRKLDYATKHPQAKVHTVVFDERTKKVYYREGVGSFRLSSMQQVKVKDLKEILKAEESAAEKVKEIKATLTKKYRVEKVVAEGVPAEKYLSVVSEELDNMFKKMPEHCF